MARWQGIEEGRSWLRFICSLLTFEGRPLPERVQRHAGVSMNGGGALLGGLEISWVVREGEATT